MQIIFEKQPLLEAVQRVLNAVDKKNTIPVLSNLLLEVVGENASLTGTNLELGISTIVPVQQIIDIGNGSITFPAHKIFEILRELPDKPVHIFVDENHWITITCGKANFKIAGLPKNDFPDIHQEDEDIETISLSGETLRVAIEHVLYAVSHDESRYALTGVLWRMDVLDQTIIFVATDGHRLAVHAEKHDVSKECERIVPLKGMVEVKKLCTHDVTITFSASRITVKSGDTTLYSRLIDAQFPDYAKVIPEYMTKAFTVKRVELQHALRRVSVLTSDTRLIKMSTTENSVTLSANDPNLGESEDTIEATYEGDSPFIIGFNAKYMQDVLGVLSGESVVVRGTDSLSPIHITCGDDIELVSVIMPMRV